MSGGSGGRELSFYCVSFALLKSMYMYYLLKINSSSSPTIYYFLLPLLNVLTARTLCTHTPSFRRCIWTVKREQVFSFVPQNPTLHMHTRHPCVCHTPSHPMHVPNKSPLYEYVCFYVHLCMCIYVYIGLCAFDAPLLSTLTYARFHVCTPGWRPPITRQNRSYSKALKGPNYRWL